MKKKQTPFQILKLAEDLGLKVKDDPIDTIFDHCERRIDGFISEMGECGSLSDLLEWVANKADTTFRVINSQNDLFVVRQEFIDKGEKAFANFENDLSEDVYGITYRLQNAKSWEPSFVSVIDSRGDKAARSYFTKWHEIAHLLTLTQQMRLVFRRTHTPISGQDPEERLMDKIAGKFGFYAPIFHKFIENEISFEEIERLREKLCPEASQLASLINFVKYWNSPCIFVRAELALKKDEEAQLSQGCFDFFEQPLPTLRAVRVVPNEKARRLNLSLFKNMRVPQNSIMQQMHIDKVSFGEAVEDISWWTAQPSRFVRVKARLIDAAVVEALIIPLD